MWPKEMAGYPYCLLEELFLWLFLLVYIQSKSNQEPIRDWLDSKSGKLALLLLFIQLLFLMIIAAFTMVETLQWINTTFYRKPL